MTKGRDSSIGFNEARSNSFLRVLKVANGVGLRGKTLALVRAVILSEKSGIHFA